MNNIRVFFLLAIFLAFPNHTFASVIYQEDWYLAIEKKDSVAQYKIAEAYSPLTKNDSYYCQTDQLYFSHHDKKLSGCRDKSADKYIEFLTKSAENLYPIAQKDLGIAYIKGELVPKDIKKGLYWLERAASPIPDKAKFRIVEGTFWLAQPNGKKIGVGEAHYWLGLLYHEGTEVKADYAKAIKHYKIASTSTDWGFYNLAQYQLYKLYQDKLNDPKKSLYWLENTANNTGKFVDEKTLETSMQMANYFLEGGQPDGSKLDTPNYLWAAKWLLKVAEQSNISKESKQIAAFQLGWFYLNGLGVEKDIGEAIKYYHLGMYQDDLTDYQMNLKKYKYVTSSTDMSLQNQFLHQVITPFYINNFDIAKAQKVIDVVFADNPKDKEVFYEKLIEDLVETLQVESYALLREFESIPLLLKLAQQQEIAYGFYRDARNIEGKTTNELIDLYQSALKIEPNNPTVLYQFGTLYDFILEDEKTAITYYQRAAELGNSKANYRLGIIYYLGKGVEQSYHEAWQYLDLAAKQGYQPAQYFLITIDKSHPEFDWLTTQYLNHQQVYHSPTVMVDGMDWLQTQSEENQNDKATYHQIRHDSNGNGLKTYQGCKAALSLAANGDTFAQGELLSQMNNGANSFICTPKKELLFSWIDSSNKNDKKKAFLKTQYYKLSKQYEQFHTMLKAQVAANNPYAIFELAQKQVTLPNNTVLPYLKTSLKSGSPAAAGLLAFYYDNTNINTFEYTKLVLLQNDLSQYHLDPEISEYYQKNRFSKYFYANLKLSSTDIYKIWFELAQMHEQGKEIPQNNVLALVWYRLLVEYNQTKATTKVAQISAQLTEEQQAEVNNILSKYRNLYRFLPLTHLDINE
ncbi:TPR repeat [Gilliamella bombicola]|uniref:TPR repeat n=1 Tax=Gilliamella bombicola TaxID=1798182 RepID=A0A1C4DPH2_9GAMM|nr:tetratricopeptide repeat protein [Gilliamella bombicola]SCC33191.1 TPR repeat [Gilliamella bombicola]